MIFPLRYGCVLGVSIVLDIPIIGCLGSKQTGSWCLSWLISFHACAPVGISTLPCYLPCYSSGLSWCVIVDVCCIWWWHLAGFCETLPSSKRAVLISFFFLILLDIIDLLANQLFHWRNFDLSSFNSNGFVDYYSISVKVPPGLTNQGKWEAHSTPSSRQSPLRPAPPMDHPGTLSKAWHCPPTRVSQQISKTRICNSSLGIIQGSRLFNKHIFQGDATRYWHLSNYTVYGRKPKRRSNSPLPT